MNRQTRVILVALLAVVGILILLPSGYVGAGGMVWNQGFEEGAAEVPDAWNLTGNATRVDTGPIYADNWSAQITGDGGVLTQWVLLGNITMPVTYEVWGWVYVSGNVTGIISVDFWAGVAENGTQLSSTTLLSANDTNGVYVQKTAMVQAPMCTTHARIRLLGSDWDKGGEARFDEIGCFAPYGFCFIATAAYGTEAAAELNILRDFRDQVLLKNPLGSRFVETYYRVSPPIADFIAKNDVLRAIVRELFIDPVVNLLQWSQGLWRA
jgi:hypothetical protein